MTTCLGCATDRPQGKIDLYGPSEGSFSTDLLGSVAGIAVDEDEEVYTPAYVTHTNGESERYAGGSGDSREGALALSMPLNSPRDVTIGPDGSRYILEDFSFVSSSARILKIGPSLPGLGISDVAVPSADGSEVYIFNFEGRHLRTLNAVTGTVRYEFAYNVKGRLTTITDVDGNVTTIERDANAKPLVIVALGGQITSLTLNGEGWLEHVSNPALENTQLAYGPPETGTRNPKGQTFGFCFQAAQSARVGRALARRSVADATEAAPWRRPGPKAAASGAVEVVEQMWQAS